MSGEQSAISKIAAKADAEVAWAKRVGARLCVSYLALLDAIVELDDARNAASPESGSPETEETNQ